jgi:Domain of unknown function (DUF4864)
MLALLLRLVHHSSPKTHADRIKPMLTLPITQICPVHIGLGRRALLVWAMGSITTASYGASLNAEDEKAARDVVAAQLAAFAADDGKKAFALAAAPIQAIFKTPAQFMAMVQAQYPVVYRPASVAYFKPEVDGDNIIMKVQMTDAKDTPWLAVYSLQRPAAKDKTKSWRIAGCIVTTNVGRTA